MYYAQPLFCVQPCRGACIGYPCRCRIRRAVIVRGLWTVARGQTIVEKRCGRVKHGRSASASRTVAAVSRERQQPAKDNHLNLCTIIICNARMNAGSSFGAYHDTMVASPPCAPPPRCYSVHSLPHSRGHLHQDQRPHSASLRLT